MEDGGDSCCGGRVIMPLSLYTFYVRVSLSMEHNIDALHLRLSILNM